LSGTPRRWQHAAACPAGAGTASQSPRTRLLQSHRVPAGGPQHAADREQRPLRTGRLVGEREGPVAGLLHVRHRPRANAAATSSPAGGPSPGSPRTAVWPATTNASPPLRGYDPLGGRWSTRPRRRCHGPPGRPQPRHPSRRAGGGGHTSRCTRRRRSPGERSPPGRRPANPASRLRGLVRRRRPRWGACVSGNRVRGVWVGL
jgi:hypothetical protein